jgi:transcription elongation factor SPT5
MQKFFNKQNDPDKLLIKSAICPEHLKGYVYVEADKESHVKAVSRPFFFFFFLEGPPFPSQSHFHFCFSSKQPKAIKGMRNLFEYNMKLVPIKEMTEVLTVTKKSAALKRGDFVRVIRGLYKGDLAEVWTRSTKIKEPSFADAETRFLHETKGL